MQLQPQRTQHKTARAYQDQDEKDVTVADAKAPQLAAAADAAEGVLASPRAASSSPRSNADTGCQRRKPWGSSMTLRGPSRGGSQSFGGSSNSSRNRAVGSRQRDQPAKRGLSQSSLQLRSGVSTGHFLDSFAGQQTTGRSRSEGGTPRADGRLPSFMDSTRSSQAHVHRQQFHAAADIVEKDVHREPFRPTGVHVMINSSSDAAEGMPQQAQHAQHGHPELTPGCLIPAGADSCTDSTQSSSSQHHGELRRRFSQHAHKKDGELASEHDGVSMHRSEWSRADQVCKVSAAARGGEMLSDHAQPSDPDNVARLLPRSAGSGVELQNQPQALNMVGTVSEKGQGVDGAKRPSFMLPTASSLAHTAAGTHSSLGKSVSVIQI